MFSFHFSCITIRFSSKSTTKHPHFNHFFFSKKKWCFTCRKALTEKRRLKSVLFSNTLENNKNDENEKTDLERRHSDYLTSNHFFYWILIKIFCWISIEFFVWILIEFLIDFFFFLDSLLSLKPSNTNNNNVNNTNNTKNVLARSISVQLTKNSNLPNHQHLNNHKKRNKKKKQNMSSSNSSTMSSTNWLNSIDWNKNWKVHYERTFIWLFFHFITIFFPYLYQKTPCRLQTNTWPWTVYRALACRQCPRRPTGVGPHTVQPRQTLQQTRILSCFWRSSPPVHSHDHFQCDCDRWQTRFSHLNRGFSTDPPATGCDSPRPVLPVGDSQPTHKSLNHSSTKW